MVGVNGMTKKVLSIYLFIIGFVGTYFVLCYCVPGLRIKLAAEPLEYLVESIKYAYLFKSVTSFVVGIGFAILPCLAKN